MASSGNASEVYEKICWKKANEREQIGQTSRVGIHLKDRFSRWFLFFRSPSYSPHQNPLNLKNRGGGVSPFPAVPAMERGGYSFPRLMFFTLGNRVSLRPPWTEAGGDCPLERFPFLSFLLSSSKLCHSIIIQ